MDCILIESQGRFGLVDCGYWDQRGQITYSLEQLGVTRDNLDFIIGTHAHADHIGCMNFLVQNFNVERIYLMPFSADCLTEPEKWTDESWDNVMRTADEMGLPVVDAFAEGAGMTPWLEENGNNGGMKTGDSVAVENGSSEAESGDSAAAENRSGEAGPDSSLPAADESLDLEDESGKAESKDNTAAKDEGKASSASTKAGDSTASKTESNKAESKDNTAAKAESKASSASTKAGDGAASKAESGKAEPKDNAASKAESNKTESKDNTSAKVDGDVAAVHIVTEHMPAQEKESSAVDTQEKEQARPANHYTAEPYFIFGDARIDILNYSQDYLTEKVVNANDTSLVVKVTAGGHTALLTGDLSNAGPRGSDPGYDETMIAKQVGHVDILKLPHHGYGWYSTNTVGDLRDFHADHIVQTGATNMLFTDKPDTYDEIIREVKRGAKYVSTFWYDRRVIGGDGLYAITYDMEDLTSNVPEDVQILTVNRDGRSIMFKGGSLAGFVYDEKTYLSNGYRNDYGTIEIDGVFYEIDNNSRILKAFD